MTRLRIVVEGQSEEGFVKELLYEPLILKNIFVSPIIVYKPGQRGGLTSYQRAKNDVLRTLKSDKATYCSTMFDFYRLPKDFPGMSAAGSLNPRDRVKKVECAFRSDVIRELGSSFDGRRFVPYIQLHEFEALLFSDPAALARAVQKPSLEDKLLSILTVFRTPEDINDDPNTAPSKRLAKLFHYKKVHDSKAICKEIGLVAIRRKCDHFNQWLGLLESLPGS